MVPRCGLYLRGRPLRGSRRERSGGSATAVDRRGVSRHRREPRLLSAGLIVNGEARRVTSKSLVAMVFLGSRGGFPERPWWLIVTVCFSLSVRYSGGMFDALDDRDPSFVGSIYGHASGAPPNRRLVSVRPADPPAGPRDDSPVPDGAIGDPGELADRLVARLGTVDDVLDEVLAGLAGCDASGALTVAGGLARLSARLEGVTMQTQVQLARQRPADPDRGDPTDEPYSGLAADELAAELGQAPRTMSGRLGVAWEVGPSAPGRVRRVDRRGTGSYAAVRVAPADRDPDAGGTGVGRGGDAGG